MADFSITYGDTLPILSVTLTDSSGAAITLAAATSVTAHLLRYANTSGEAVTGAAVVSKTMTIASPSSSGVVTYTFLTTDYGTASGKLPSGYYYIEFQILYNSGAILTVPTPDTRYTLYIRDDLD